MRVGAENPVTPCDLRVFADQAAESAPAQDPDVCLQDGWIRVPGGRVLSQCLMQPVEVPFAGDQHLVQALAAGAEI